MNKEKIKKTITIENLLYLSLILCPILDSASYLFRNKYNTNLSISTFVRPLIPIIVIVYIFFNEKIKTKMLFASLIYGIYAIIHLVIFNKIVTNCAYGNVLREAQYIINYTFMIMNLFIYLYIFIIKENDSNKRKINIQKLRITLLITFSIYLIIMYVSIITGTASHTYIEDNIGYKGWFESGNSVGAIMILSLFIIMPMLENKDLNKKIKIWICTDIVLSGIYLTMLLGTRVGLFGFLLTILSYITLKIMHKLKNNNKISKKNILIGASISIAIILIISTIGSATLARRKLLKEREAGIYDESLGEEAHVTGDILNFIPRINKGDISENYMSKEMQKSILDLYNFNNAHHVSNTNMRMIQLVYHSALVKNQHNILLILFGNGYMTHYYELIFEMEVPAFLYNFGLIGFTIYFIPFLIITIYGIKYIFKNKKVDYIMENIALCFGILSSFLAGYTFFSASTETIIIAICTMIFNNVMEGKKSGKNNIWNN